MGYRDMQKPLLQSAVVLLAVLLIIGFVAGSGAESIFGGIFSIFKGIIYTILFTFALIVALIVSVVFLIAILLGGVAIYSPDSAREMFFRLRNRAATLFSSWTTILEPNIKSEAPQDATVSPAPKKEESTATEASKQSMQNDFIAELAEIKKNIAKLSKDSGSTADLLASMEDTLAAIPVAEIVKRTEELESRQEDLNAKLSQCLENLKQVQTQAEGGLKNVESQGKEISATQSELKKLSSDLEAFRSDLKKLQENSRQEEKPADLDEEKYRIFTYLDQEKDKKQLAELIAQAIEKNMTYAEIDDFLTEKLPEKLDAIIKDHPSLTKEYIRDCRNN